MGGSLIRPGPPAPSWLWIIQKETLVDPLLHIYAFGVGTPGRRVLLCRAFGSTHGGLETAATRNLKPRMHRSSPIL